MVVVMDLMMDGLEELTQTIKAVHVTKLILKTTIKGFLVTVLPGRSHIADRDLDSLLPEIVSAAIRHKLVALVGMKNRRFDTSGQRLLDSREHELTVVMLADAVSHDLSSSPVFNRCQIPDRALIDHAAHITAPHLMGLRDCVQIFEQVVIRMGRCRTGRVVLGWSPWRTQIEQCHHPLGTLVVDAQMQGYPAMSIGGMVTMDGFNLAFECQVFGRLPSLTIDVFPIDTQRIGAKRFLLRLPHYFDFF